MQKSRSEQIFDHAQKFATPLRTTLGYTWAIVPDGRGRFRGYPVSSHGFQHWLAHSFHTEHSIFPGAMALEGAVRMFAAHARHSDFPVSDVFTRVGWHGDPRIPQSILLYLANANEELVEITHNGHHIVSSESWHFMTGPATLPLPRPIDNKVTLATICALCSTSTASHSNAPLCGSSPPCDPLRLTPLWSSAARPAAANPCSPACSAISSIRPPFRS